MRRVAAGVTLLGVAFGAASAAVPEPDGYRMDHYRSPVPDTLHGAQVLHTAALQAFIAERHPVLVDVLSSPAPPVDSRGLPRMPLPQVGLPGSVWLPDVGRGALSPATEAWFARELAAVTHRNLGTPVVFYCLSQCWMSWNAARRAVAHGYRQVVWYPDGADGWQSAGLATAPLKRDDTGGVP